jgi:hypothetical protein
MTELVMCRRGPERQAGAARPDLVNAAILPSAQPPEPIPVACARASWKDFQRRTCQAAGQPGARSRCSTVNGDAPRYCWRCAVLHLLTRWSLRAHADRPAGSSALRRSPAPAHAVSEASPLRKFHRPGRTAGTPLEAAARSMARGASGVWLRAVSRLSLVCRGTVYLLVGYLACASRSPPTGAAPRPRAAPVPCRRSPSLPRDVSCWACSSPGSPPTRSPSSSRPCSGLPMPPARWAGGASVRSRRGDVCCTLPSA